MRTCACYMYMHMYMYSYMWPTFGELAGFNIEIFGF